MGRLLHQPLQQVELGFADAVKVGDQVVGIVQNFDFAGFFAEKDGGSPAKRLAIQPVVGNEFQNVRR